MENNFNSGLEERVFEKLEKKMAIEEFKTKEKRTSKSYTGIKVASILIMVAIFAGNAFTYATDNENIFSWILNRIGIFGEYNEEKTDINITKENNGISLTLTDYGIDKNTLIVGYNLKLNQEEEFIQKLFNESKIINGTDIYGLGEKNMELYYKVSDTEYTIYEFYVIDAENLKDDVSFESRIKLYRETDDPAEYDILSEWEFKIPLDKERIMLDYEEYVLEDKTVILERDESYPWELSATILGLKNSSLTTKLVVFIEGYTTDPGIRYFVEVLDENGKALLENFTEYGVGGVPTDIIFKKIDTNSKIKVNFYEASTNTKEIFAKGTIDLDLSKDLKEKEERQVSKTKRTWRGIEFEYNKDNGIYEDEHTKSTGGQPTGYSLMMSIYEEIKGMKYHKETIQMYAYENLRNYNLDEAFEFKKKLEAFSLGYDIGDRYWINTDKKEGYGWLETTITHEQMETLLNGGDITSFAYKSDEYPPPPAGYITFNIKDFSGQEVKFADERKIKIDNVDAITYTETIGETVRKYMFLHDGYIYEISCPTGFDVKQEVEEFIDSIRIKE